MMTASGEAGAPHTLPPAYEGAAETDQDTHDATVYSDTSPLLAQNSNKRAPVHGDNAIRTYWWRWVVLCVFSLNLALTNVLWISFASIADVMVCYYGVNNFWVNALSMVFMAVYILLVFPCAWLLDRYGLRLVVVLGSCFNALGAALRIIGSGYAHYWVLLLGQTIAAISNAFIWGAAPLLSETWFSPSERATATAIAGAIAPQCGVLMGFILSPFIVHRAETVDLCGNGTTPVVNPPPLLFNDWRNTISDQMFYYMLGQAGICLVVLLLTFVAFPNAPPSPPSISRQLETYSHKSSAEHNLRNACTMAADTGKNIYFLIFCVTTAIMIAVPGAVISVINEIVLPYFPGMDQQIGYLGAVIQGTSLVVMLAIGFILDYTKAYYAVNVTICVMATVSVGLFSALVQFQPHFYFLYITAVLMGVGLAGFQAVAYEYAVEMTYPLPEGLSAGILNVGSQVLSIVVIVVMGRLIDTNHIPFGNWFLTGLTAFSALLAIFTRPELRRVKIDSREKKGTSSRGKVTNIQQPSLEET